MDFGNLTPLEHALQAMGFQKANGVREAEN